MKKLSFLILLFILISLAQYKFLESYSPKNRLNFSGCCSWHKGIKNCDKKAQKIICNDLTYSPSCECQ